MERFELPPTSVPFYSVCFTSPPTSRDCFVFGIIRKVPGYATEFGLIKVGDGEWELGPIVNNFKPGQRFTHCPPLFYNGVFYCVNYTSRGLRIFDPKKNGHDRWIPNRDVACLDGDDEEVETEDREIEFENYIAQVDGEICGVFVTNDDRKVSVRKWDFGRSRWKKLKSLGDKCLYVSRTGMFAEACSVTSGMENKIYFNKFRGKSGVLYSLATRMYHSIEGDFSSRYAYGFTHVEHGSWIKLSAL
ncbi:F-box/kelch-repeat protein at1g57790 [Phtheirospermum japonicum]|uniref:F-box/kelch-repeat protein at1g57790 n=1 Tax=Phtheirospermum japonicum TaxID=374723 RepID=A0A830BZ67_9LAMI|nr:F-box/kelch-repeat protein at1g57790 [Phtheirospermum japonicum]